MRKAVHLVNGSILAAGAITNEEILVIISILLSALSILYDYFKEKGGS